MNYVLHMYHDQISEVYTIYGHQLYPNLYAAVEPSVSTVEVAPTTMQAPMGYGSGMWVREGGVGREGRGGGFTSVQAESKLGTFYHI